MTQDNKLASPKFAIGDTVCVSWVRPFIAGILNRRWNPNAYLGGDGGLGGWQYLVKGDHEVWLDEETLVKVQRVP